MLLHRLIRAITRGLFAQKADLVMENSALRQQLPFSESSPGESAGWVDRVSGMNTSGTLFPLAPCW